MGGILELETEESLLHARLGPLVEVLEGLGAVIDLAAILILLIGAARFIAGVALAEIRRDDVERVRKTNRERVELGRYILAGLELFIVSDVIHTALSLAMSDLIFLLVLVIIRSITSFFLERELGELKKELGQ